MEFDVDKIEKAAASEVADHLLGGDRLYKKVDELVAARINKHFSEVADKQIVDAITKAVQGGFEREYQRVNQYGQKQGDKTTIRAELEKIVDGYWTQRVRKSDGKPSTDSYHSISRAEWMMLQICSDSFSEEMKQHVINVGGALKDALRSQLHETVNRLLSDVFKVRSLDDQGKDRRDGSMIQPPEKR